MGEYKAAKKSLQAALTALSSMSNICSKEKEKNATILQQAIDKFSKKEDTKEKDTGATEEPRRQTTKLHTFLAATLKKIGGSTGQTTKLH